MDVKGFSVLEKVLFFFLLFSFLSLVFLIIFQKEQLDDLIYGPSSEQEEFVDRAEILEENFSSPSGFLEISFSDSGRGLASLSFNREVNLTGFEFVFGKDSSLKIPNFVCLEPFECIYFEEEDTVVSFTGLLPLELAGKVPSEDIDIGYFEYSGTGDITLLEKSLVASFEYPELNILDFSFDSFSFK